MTKAPVKLDPTIKGVKEESPQEAEKSRKELFVFFDPRNRIAWCWLRFLNI